MLSVLPQHQEAHPLHTGIHLVTLHSSIMLNYAIQSPCFVQLGIYTISGKKVAVIENGERASGEYSVSFNAGKIPAGLYVYRFQAGSYQESNRIMVIK